MDDGAIAESSIDPINSEWLVNGIPYTVDSWGDQIPVFEPSSKDFEHFPSFIDRITDFSSKYGICKVRPPSDWRPRKQGYDNITTDLPLLPHPIKQVVQGGRGSFVVLNVELKDMTHSSFKASADALDVPDEAAIGLPEVERAFWRNVLYNPPLYGADILGSIFDTDVRQWNPQNLGTFLSSLGEIPGVTKPYLYVGSWKACFAWHTEDKDLYSINYLHYGKPKFWYSLPHTEGLKFERLAKSLYADHFRSCPQYLRHKMALIAPFLLKSNGITYRRLVQREREFVITFPGAYHAGFNLGYNIAESVNFASRYWIPFGLKAVSCCCESDAVRINVPALVAQLDNPGEFLPNKLKALQMALCKKENLKDGLSGVDHNHDNSYNVGDDESNNSTEFHNNTAYNDTSEFHKKEVHATNMNESKIRKENEMSPSQISTPLVMQRAVSEVFGIMAEPSEHPRLLSPYVSPFPQRSLPSGVSSFFQQGPFVPATRHFDTVKHETGRLSLEVDTGRHRDVNLLPAASINRNDRDYFEMSRDRLNVSSLDKDHFRPMASPMSDTALPPEFSPFKIRLTPGAVDHKKKEKKEKKKKKDKKDKISIDDNGEEGSVESNPSINEQNVSSVDKYEKNNINQNDDIVTATHGNSNHSSLKISDNNLHGTANHANPDENIALTTNNDRTTNGKQASVKFLYEDDHDDNPIINDDNDDHDVENNPLTNDDLSVEDNEYSSDESYDNSSFENEELPVIKVKMSSDKAGMRNSRNDDFVDEPVQKKPKPSLIWDEEARIFRKPTPPKRTSSTVKDSNNRRPPVSNKANLSFLDRIKKKLRGNGRR